MERDESTGHKMGRNVTNPPPLHDESTGHKRDLHPRVTHPPQLPVIQNLETIPPTAAPPPLVWRRSCASSRLMENAVATSAATTAVSRE